MRSPIVCLHGWCCDARDFDLQTQYFSKTRRIISSPWQANLLGHEGLVDLEVAASGIESECLASKLDGPPILVGHSMGGMLAAMIARNRTLPIKAIVVIDATWPLDQSSSDFFQSFIPDLESDFKTTIRDFFMNRLVSADDDPDITREVVDRVVQSDQEIGLALFRDLQTPHRLPVAEDVGVPIMGISSSLQFLDRDTLLDHSPQSWFGQIPGSGHFMMQQATSQLNAMLDSFFDHVDG